MSFEHKKSRLRFGSSEDLQRAKDAISLVCNGIGQVTNNFPFEIIKSTHTMVEECSLLFFQNNSHESVVEPFTDSELGCLNAKSPEWFIARSLILLQMMLHEVSLLSVQFRFKTRSFGSEKANTWSEVSECEHFLQRLRILKQYFFDHFDALRQDCRDK